MTKRSRLLTNVNQNLVATLHSAAADVQFPENCDDPEFEINSALGYLAELARRGVLRDDWEKRLCRQPQAFVEALRDRMARDGCIYDWSVVEACCRTSWVEIEAPHVLEQGHTGNGMQWVSTTDGYRYYGLRLSSDARGLLLRAHAAARVNPVPMLQSDKIWLRADHGVIEWLTVDEAEAGRHADRLNLLRPTRPRTVCRARTNAKRPHAANTQP